LFGLSHNPPKYKRLLTDWRTLAIKENSLINILDEAGSLGSSFGVVDVI